MHRRGQLLASIDRDPAGFLAVHILARLSGEDGGRRVPSISSGDQDGINILASEQFTEVTIQFAMGVLIEPIDQGFASIAAGCLNIRDCHAAHVGGLEHPTQDIAAARADANDPELDLVIGGDRISRQGGNRRKQKRPAHG